MPWTGFHRLNADDRVARIVHHAGLDAAEAASLRHCLALSEAEVFVENAVGAFCLPLGLAVHFVVDGEPVVVPMAVEESSVVAAASHGAKMAAAGGGFKTQVAEPVTIGQVELRDVGQDASSMSSSGSEAVSRKGSSALPSGVADAVAARKQDWMAWLDEQMPSMVARGGGMRDIVARGVGDRVVLHLHVDCRDAMGANIVNTLCELLAPRAAQELGGTPGLRILSNLAMERLATAAFEVPVEAVGGSPAAHAIVAANDFALEDPYRAATHNKGIMNGIDPVAVATGNDWRAIEAGAHAYAARHGSYRGLTRYAVEDGRLRGELTLPLMVGTVGGVTSLHPSARTSLKILGRPDSRRLAAIMASVGLAQNLAALRALSSEGIQQGHMALHARNVALQAGLTGAAAHEVARRMVQEGRISPTRARELSKGQP